MRAILKKTWLAIVPVLALSLAAGVAPLAAQAVACGDFVLQWGTPGTGAGEFASPTGIATDPSGNVYVVDSGNNRIQKFNSSGVPVNSFSGGTSNALGSIGSGDGQFDGPAGIALDSSGNIYVSDSNNSRIEKFSSSGAFLLAWGSFGSAESQFDSPNGVIVDSSGNVYVVDTGNNRIQKFNSSGSPVFSFSGGTSNALGSIGSGPGQFSGPADIAVDSSGNIYVSDSSNDRIQKFNSSGTFLLSWGTSGSDNGLFSTPRGIAAAPFSTVFVVDLQNTRTQRFDSVGTFLNSWVFSAAGGQFAPAAGIAVDSSSGSVYISDTNNNQIQKFACPLVPPTPPPTPTPTPPPAKDILTFNLQKIDQKCARPKGENKNKEKDRESCDEKSTKTTTSPIAGAELRVFDCKDPAFRTAYRPGRGDDRDDHGNCGNLSDLLAAIYAGGIAQISSCVTDGGGACTAYESAPGHYLVIGKFMDPSAPNATVYVSKSKDPKDFNTNLESFLDLKVQKFFKNGVFRKYGPEGKVKVLAFSGEQPVAGLNGFTVGGLFVVGLALGLFIQLRGVLRRKS